MASVALVQMPYAAVHHPSMALGLLKGYLSGAGIAAEVVYGNLRWAEELGLDVYLVVQESHPNDLLGEWTFSAAAFPGSEQDVVSFRRLAPHSFDGQCMKALQALHPGLDVEELYSLVRERAVHFIDRLATEILASGARIVGCSSMFQQHCAALALLRRVHEKDPQVVTLLGGANCEGSMGAATHAAFPWVDFVASGEADAYFARFCAELLEHGRDLPPAKLPSGVLGPAQRGRPTVALQPSLVSDMDATGVPDYDDYFAQLARSTVAPYVRPGLLIETSRGCWYGARRTCAFCGLNGDRLVFRSKSGARVQSELAELARRHGVRHIAAVDNILDLAYFDDLLPGLAETGRLYEIFFEVRPNLSRTQVERLAAAGIRWLQAGLEHLHDAVLARVEKGTSALQNVTFLKWTRGAGVHVAWNLLYGAPGEQDGWYDELCAWVPWIAHLQPPTGIARIRFDRFSPYFVEAQQHGLELVPYPTYAAVYGLSDTQLRQLAYFFTDERLAKEWDLGRHPGLRRLGQQVGAWRAAFWGAQAGRGRPVLSFSRQGDDLVVRDTRSVALAAEVRLSGLAAAVYEACAEPAMPHTVQARLATRFRSAGDAAIVAQLEELSERRLVLHLGSRYLALAVPEPVRELPEMVDAPEGFISMVNVLNHCAPHSFARQAVRAAWDLPVLAAFGQGAGER